MDMQTAAHWVKCSVGQRVCAMVATTDFQLAGARELYSVDWMVEPMVAVMVADWEKRLAETMGGTMAASKGSLRAVWLEIQMAAEWAIRLAVLMDAKTADRWAEMLGSLSAA